MGSFKLGRMTLKSLVSKPETTLYPFQVKTPPAGLKGSVAIDMTTCILCSKCAKACPAGAIEVDKKDGSWAIDRFRCVQCGSCIRACPKESLSMEPHYQKPSREMTSETFRKPEDSPEEKARKEAEKRAKLEAAMKAKAEREANA